MNRILTITLLLSATMATAQGAPRTFSVGRFDAVELSSSDNVRVISGNDVSVSASGDPRAVAALAIDVRQGTLHVSRRPGNSHDNGALVTVVVPTLRAARIAGSGDLTVGTIAGPRFEGDVFGSGNLKLPQLRADTARFDMGGSGSITVAGSAGDVAINLGGSGRIDTHALRTTSLSVEVGGSGDVRASASRSASVRANGSGNVHVEGGARCDVHQSGSATVQCG